MRECTVIDYNINKDLAIIKLKSVSGLTLKPIVFGDSDSLMIGEGAVIIGNAYGLGISVTTGTITNKNPVNLDDERDVIQTDTAINSGNSGGPVFDIMGSCVGVATYKIVSNSSSSATTEGLGFALASNFATAYLTAEGVDYTTYMY
jgi:Trypsin-like serine proteases, typically periplasmic, contain C-terminal PDZ domain